LTKRVNPRIPDEVREDPTIWSDIHMKDMVVMIRSKARNMASRRSRSLRILPWLKIDDAEGSPELSELV
jgi:hypothetical protein